MYEINVSINDILFWVFSCLTLAIAWFVRDKWKKTESGIEKLGKKIEEFQKIEKLENEKILTEVKETNKSLQSFREDIPQKYVLKKDFEKHIDKTEITPEKYVLRTDCKDHRDKLEAQISDLSMEAG